jgi:flagellar motility protein MotE (MotC chaperone)
MPELEELAKQRLEQLRGKRETIVKELASVDKELKSLETRMNLLERWKEKRRLSREP